MAERPANIHDVAALTGVAPSTVSRALSSQGRISGPTRERIRAAANQLGYVPSRQARALSSGRTGIVAVLVPDISHPGHAGLLKGIHNGLKSAGYAQLLIDTESSAGVEACMLHQMRKAADGIILAQPLLGDAELLAAAAQQPLVVVNKDLPGLAGVVACPGPAISAALDHLIDAGHSHIAYVCGDGFPALGAGFGRAELIRAAELRNLDITIWDSHPLAGGAGSAAADAVLASGATACFASSSVLALGMLNRFRQRRASVPGDVSLIGCDDVFGTEFSAPALSTISPPAVRVGRTAASMLAGIIAGSVGTFPDASPQRIYSALTLRSSIAAVRGSRRPAQT